LSDFSALGGEKRFFSTAWEKGLVTTGYGTSVSTNYKFNYDFLDKQLYTLYKDTVVAVDPNFIASFYLEKNNKMHFFHKGDDGNFLESVHFDSTKKNSFQLLKSRVATLVRGDKSSYLSNFSGDYGDNIKVKTEYYIMFPDAHLSKVKLEKKSLSIALKDYSKKTEIFFTSTKDVNEENIALLLNLLNS